MDNLLTYLTYIFLFTHNRFRLYTVSEPRNRRSLRQWTLSPSPRTYGGVWKGRNEEGCFVECKRKYDRCDPKWKLHRWGVVVIYSRILHDLGSRLRVSCPRPRPTRPKFRVVTVNYRLTRTRYPSCCHGRSLSPSLLLYSTEEVSRVVSDCSNSVSGESVPRVLDRDLIWPLRIGQ